MILAMDSWANWIEEAVILLKLGVDSLVQFHTSNIIHKRVRKKNTAKSTKNFKYWISTKAP